MTPDAMAKARATKAAQLAERLAFARTRIAHAEAVTGRTAAEAMNFSEKRVHRDERSRDIRAEFCAVMLEPDAGGRRASPNEVATVLGISRWAVNNGARRWKGKNA